MAQNITLTLAGKEYKMSASTPEVEEALRKCAARINKKYAEWTKNFIGKPREDILAMIAMEESVGAFRTDRELELAQEECRQLESQLEAYLQDK